MALSVLLRSAAKPLAFRSALSGTLRLPVPVLRNAVALTNNAYLSQLCSQNHKRSLEVTPKSKLVSVLHNVQVRSAHFDHGLLWTTEKVLTVALLAIVPLTFLSPSPIMDNIFAITCIMHNHWGLEAVVIDYVRPVLFGNVIPKIALMFLYAFSAIVLAGLLSFNMNDIGIGRAVNKLWRIRDKQ